MKTNKKLRLISFGVIMICVVAAVFSLYYREDFLGFNSFTQVVEAPHFASSTTPAAATSSASSETVASLEPNDSVLKDWKLVVNKKHGFSYYEPKLTPPFSVDTYESSESLSAFTESIWALNKYDTNPYVKGKMISEITKSFINGSTAYQFTLSKSFTWDSEGSGYILDEPHLYTFFETKNGTKVVTHAPVISGDNSQPNPYISILSSFNIDENLIPKDEAAADWQTIDDDLYTFKYPSNLFKINQQDGLDNVLYLTDVVEGMRGDISVITKEIPFDKNEISGMYGKIENPGVVSIGDRLWYWYGDGDAGYAARVYVTGIGATQTLRVSFSSLNEEAVYPLAEDIALQQEILATFSK